MNNIEIIGFIAAFLSTAAFLPQVYKTWRTKDVSGLSLPMLILFIVGIVLWFVYALFINSPSMIVANAITIVSSSFLIYFKIVYDKK